MGFTLLELAAALSLIGVVGLSFAHLYLTSQQQLTQAVLIESTQAEAAIAL